MKLQRRWLWWLLAVILLGLAVAWIVSRLEWEDYTRRGRMSGEALRNPYHAGMLMVGRLGYAASKHDGAVHPAKLPTRSTLLLADNAITQDRDRRAALLAWVRNGGHLVLPLRLEGADTSPLLDALGIKVDGWSVGGSYPVRLDDNVLQIDMPRTPVYRSSLPYLWEVSVRGSFRDEDGEWEAASGEEPEEEENDAEASPGEDAPRMRPFHVWARKLENAPLLSTRAVMTRMRLDEGTVTLVPDHPLRNSNIEEHDHAGLFLLATTLPHDTRPLLIALRSEHASLADWLRAHALHTLWAAAILLAACLWHCMRRFGPVLPEPPPARPGLLEHLSASGDFLLREQQYEALLQPLRDDVQRALHLLRGRHPEIDDDATLAAHLSGLPVAEIQRALQPSPPDAGEFQLRCHILAEIRAHCARMRQTSPLQEFTS